MRRLNRLCTSRDPWAGHFLRLLIVFVVFDRGPEAAVDSGRGLTYEIADRLRLPRVIRMGLSTPAARCRAHDDWRRIAG